jgi:ribonuclease P protein component
VPKAGKDSPYPTNGTTKPVGKLTFPRECRLRGRDAIRHATFTGAKVPGKWLGLKVAEGSPTRFGISVSRKFGKAVRRNRIKRIIREFLRNHKPLWPKDRWVIIGLFNDPGDEAVIIAELKKALAKIK